MTSSDAGKEGLPVHQIKFRTHRVIIAAYLISLFFLGAFFLLLAKGPAISRHLEDPFWALFVAVILVIPLLVPSFIQYIAPSISKVAIPKFIEVSFARVESASFSLTSFFQGTKGFAGETIASEFAMSMTSLSMDIIDVVGKVQVTGDEVFVVDLLEGKSWIPPNLYFLAFLLMYRTSVRQIVFVETRGAQESFVGMCSTEALADALAKKFPVLSLAESESKHQEEPLRNTGIAYFRALSRLYPATLQDLQLKDLWLDSSTLLSILKTAIHRNQIKWKDILSEQDYAYILMDDHPYTAAVRDGQLEFLISRDRLALVVARSFLQRFT